MKQSKTIHFLLCYITYKNTKHLQARWEKNVINKNWAFYMHSNMNPEFIFSCFLEAKQVSSKSYPDIC